MSDDISKDGVLPPLDAVRIEEMVNYFDYDYAAARSIAKRALRRRISPFSHRLGMRVRQLLRLGIKGS